LIMEALIHEKVDKKNILDALMGYKGFRRKTDFAFFLGIRANVLSNWYSRNTFDENILMDKFPEISYAWLLTGEGPMLKDGGNGVSGNVGANHGISHVSHSSNLRVERGGAVQGAELELLKKQLEEKDGQLAEKDRQISKLLEQQARLIGKLTG